MVQINKKTPTKKMTTKKSVKAKTPVKKVVTSPKKTSSSAKAKALLASLAARKRLIAKILGASALAGAAVTGGYYAHKNQEAIKAKTMEEAAKAQEKSKGMSSYMKSLFKRKPSGPVTITKENTISSNKRWNY